MKKYTAPSPKPASNILTRLSSFLFLKKPFEASEKVENGYNKTPTLQLSQLSVTHMTKFKKILKVRRYHRLGNTMLGSPALTVAPQNDTGTFLKYLPAISEHTVMEPLSQNYACLKIMSKINLSI